MSRPVKITDIEFQWSDDFYNLGIRVDFDGRRDTFDDWTLENWRELIKLFYGRENIFGIILVMKQGDYEFTTFRAYDYRKHDYYFKSVYAKDPPDFWIQIKEPVEKKENGKQQTLGVGQ